MTNVLPLKSEIAGKESEIVQTTALAKITPPIVTTVKKKPLMKWFYMKEQNVLDTFASLPNAKKIGSGDRQFVYVPGTREDKVLLVAHADTTNSDDQVAVKYNNGKYFSINKCSIGADDRAGCAILYSLRNLGHSLLIPNGEESGCIGSNFLMEDKEWVDIVNSHNFAIQFDRRHCSDLVFYHVGSQEMVKWAEENFTGYKRADGSFTDIGKLCRTMCGMNISVGYYGEHGSGEHLMEAEWHRTLSKTREILSKPNLPKFERKYEPPIQRIYTNFYDSDRDYKSTHADYIPDWVKQKNAREYSSRPIEQYKLCDSIDYSWLVICPHCRGMMDESEQKNNKDACVFCNQII